MALAIAGTPFVPENRRIAFMPSWGTFQGEHAVSLVGTVRLTDNVLISGGFGYGLTRDTMGGRAGVMLVW